MHNILVYCMLKLNLLDDYNNSLIHLKQYVYIPRHTYIDTMKLPSNYDLTQNTSQHCASGSGQHPCATG